MAEKILFEILELQFKVGIISALIDMGIGNNKDKENLSNLKNRLRYLNLMVPIVN